MIVLIIFSFVFKQNCQDNEWLVVVRHGSVEQLIELRVALCYTA